MPFGRVLPLALVAMLAAHAAAEEPSAPGTQPSTTTTQESVVRGTPPDGLAGRWLAVSWLDIGGTGAPTVTAFWQIAEQDGKPVVTQRFGLLPGKARESFDAAGAESRRWVPSEQDLAAVRDGWNTLPTEDVSYAKVWTEIAAPDGYDQNLKAEPRTKDALWVVRQRFDASPASAPIVRQVFVYAVTGSEDGGFKGDFDGATVAAAPAAIPIAFKGTFRFYRLDAAPAPKPRGPLARILDLFRGCGR